MQKREASDACTSRIYGLPPPPCARRLGAFIHNAADIRIRGQGDPYNHHLQNLGHCAGGSGSRRIGVLRQLRHTSHPSADLRLLRQRVERCRWLDHLKRPCGRVLWKSSRAGSAVRLETEGGRPFNLRSDESASRRDKPPAGVCTEAVYSRMRGLRWRRIC